MSGQLIREFAGNNLVLILQYAASSLVPLVLVPHIVGQLGLASYGALAIALALASYGALVVQYGFNLSGPYQLAGGTYGRTELEIVREVTCAKVVLLGAVVVTITLGSTVSVALGHSLSEVQVWLLISVPIAAALNTGWHLQAVGRFAMVGAIAVGGALLATGIGLAGIRPSASDPVAIAAIALIAGPLWTGIGTATASIRRLSRFPAARPIAAARCAYWTQLRDGLPLFASQFVAALYTASGPILIGLLIGAEQAGAYSVIERISNAVAGGFLLSHTAAYPKLSQLYANDRKSYFQLMKFVIGIYLVLSGATVLLAALSWNHLLAYLFGPSSSDQGALLAGGLAWIVLGIFGTALTGYLTVRNESRRVFRLTVQVLAVSLLLGIPAVMIYGAWAWLAALALSQLLVLAVGWRAWSEEYKG